VGTHGIFSFIQRVWQPIHLQVRRIPACNPLGLRVSLARSSYSCILHCILSVICCWNGRRMKPFNRSGSTNEQTRHPSALSVQPMDDGKNSECRIACDDGTISCARAFPTWWLARDACPCLICRMDLADALGRNLT